ncbi:hypothetical protein [Nonomuraea sp. NPDC049625]|uniref:hypothetical protein n=1 Tax=Nonomuraea sp. NPDC049625 TaxID=3155775 RepID=UPI003423D4CF
MTPLPPTGSRRCRAAGRRPRCPARPCRSRASSPATSSGPTSSAASSRRTRGRLIDDGSTRENPATLSDEPRIRDYNTEYNPPGLYRPDAFRSSDHDPLVIGLTLPG